jgi:hypothetical protein
LSVEGERLLRPRENRSVGTALQETWDTVYHRSGAGYQVEIGKTRLQPLSLLLSQAATEADLEARVLCLKLLKGTEKAVDLMLGFLSDATGIEKDEVRVLRRLREIEALLGENAGDLL